MKSELQQFREMLDAPPTNCTEEEWEAYMQRMDRLDNPDGYEFPPGPAIIINDENLTAGEIEEQILIEETRNQILAGITSEVLGRVQIVRGLLRLQANDLWKKDPLVAHLENPRWKDDYLTELIEWLKEENPDIQMGLSTLQNYLKYYRSFCENFGFAEELVFGASENTRRQIYKMCDWHHGGGPPKRLRNGYDIDKLPDSDENKPYEARLFEGVREVARQALSLGRYSPDLFEAYHKGDGQEKVNVSMVLKLDEDGVIRTWTAFVKKHDAEGNPLSSFAADLLTQEMPVEVLDWLEPRGFQVEME